MQMDTSTPDIGRVISRKKMDVSEYTKDGRQAQAASIVRTQDGYAAILFVEGQPPIVETGLKGPQAAEQHIYRLLDNVIPDTYGGPLKMPREKARRKSRAKARVSCVHTGGGGKSHGRYYYTITGATEGQIKYAARRIFNSNIGYGIRFGALETIDGVLTMKGSCSDNCE